MTNKIVLNNINDLVTYNDNTILKNILALNEMTSKRNLYLQEKDIVQIIFLVFLFYSSLSVFLQ